MAHANTTCNSVMTMCHVVPCTPRIAYLVRGWLQSNTDKKTSYFNVHGSVHCKNILIYIQQVATLHSLFYLETALHVSGGTTNHHQERKQLYLQHLVFVRPLLLPAAIAAGRSNGPQRGTFEYMSWISLLQGHGQIR
jgi:hypothetical protein